MKVVHSIAEVRQAVKEARGAGKRIGFVPTMGFLHQGHLSLVNRSKQSAEFQVMSIFVNRLQFNDQSDFANYPKDLQNDIELADGAGVDLIFIPDDSEMYSNNLSSVDVELLTENLCGGHRPGHFRGVFTVVSKLFNIVQPDVAVFGQKDIQQAVSIEKMVKDLNFPVEIILSPIVREDDGLAMSSRNKHLSEKERVDALVLSRSLNKARELITSGERASGKITSEIRKIIEEGNPDSIDYVSLVGYDDLNFCDRVEGKSVIAVAAFWGTTRLIDNLIIDKEGDNFICH